jgi:hypothetical protein
MGSPSVHAGTERAGRAPSLSYAWARVVAATQPPQLSGDNMNEG